MVIAKISLIVSLDSLCIGIFFLLDVGVDATVFLYNCVVATSKR